MPSDPNTFSARLSEPGYLNPVPSYAVRRSPRRLAKHNAEVADMLLYLVRLCWPLLAADDEVEDAIDEFVVAIDTPSNRNRLIGLPDNCERWVMIAGNFFEYMTGEECKAAAVAN